MGIKHPHATRRRETRKVEAVKRLTERATISPAQQLAALDKRLGKGVGAKKERARLQKLAAAVKA